MSPPYAVRHRIITLSTSVVKGLVGGAGGPGGHDYIESGRLAKAWGEHGSSPRGTVFLDSKLSSVLLHFDTLLFLFKLPNTTWASIETNKCLVE